MKKLFIIIITSVFILSSYSCSTLPDDINTTADNSEITNNQHNYKPYKYGNIGGDYIFKLTSDYRLVKFNVHDGKRSYLCPDPFCSHDNSSCQFYNITSAKFTSIGNTVYYLRFDNKGKSAVYSYDVDKSETKEVFVYQEKSLMTNVYAYDYRLFIRTAFNYELGIKESYFWYDTKTGETENYNGDNLSIGYSLFMIRDDRVIWSDVNLTSFFSTDLKGEDFKEHDFNYRYGNHYEMEFVISDEGYKSYTLYATFGNEKERKVVLSDIGPCFYYENNLVYFKTLPKKEHTVVHTYKNGSTVKDVKGGNLYIANPDGSDARLLLHTDEFMTSLSSDSYHQDVCGDYIGICAAEFSGDEMKEDKLVIVNLKTGEFVVTHE